MPHGDMPAPSAARERVALDRTTSGGSDVLWVRLSPDAATGLQNVTHALLDEMLALLDGLTAGGGAEHRPGHVVLQSRHPEHFCVGGDLRLFESCIARGDAVALHDYSMRCLALMLGWSTALSSRATSIALVQGRALGGGFEMALGADRIIAEERSTFGFPEIVFGLFPCTGAMGLLQQRVGARQAERMMTNNRLYRARELHAMGIVDEVCADGEGEAAVARFIAERTNRHAAMLAVQRIRLRASGLERDACVRVVDDWVHAAMHLSADERRALRTLVLLQEAQTPQPSRRGSDTR